MGSTPVIMNNATDSWVYQYQPTKAQGTAGSVLYVGADSGKITRSLLYWSLPFPRGVTILSAKIRMTQYGAIAGSKTISCYRLTSSWSATKVTWNTQPTWATAGVASVTKSGTPANTVWEWDVSAQMQSISNGAGWYGFLVASSQAQTRFFSPNYTTVTSRPVLEVSWKDNPKKPTTLKPAAGRGVALAKPTLQCDFTDLSGDTSMASIQVKIFTDLLTANANTTSEFDSGEVATDVPELDLSTTAYAGAAPDATKYWRVRVKDGAGLWSDWSDPESWTYRTKGTLTINNPSFTETRRNKITNPSWRTTNTTVEVRRNIATVPNLEAGAVWPTNNGSSWTHSIDTTKFRSGTKSLKSIPVVVGASTTLMSSYNVGGSVFPVASGEVITASVYVATNSIMNCTAQLQLYWLDAGSVQVGAVVNGGIVTCAPDGTFNARPYVTGTSPGGTVTQFRLMLLVNRSSGVNVANEAAWADDCLIERQCSAVLPYFDGNAKSNVDYSWAGTAGSSISNMVAMLTRTNLFINPTCSVNAAQWTQVNQGVGTTTGTRMTDGALVTPVGQTITTYYRQLWTAITTGVLSSTGIVVGNPNADNIIGPMVAGAPFQFSCYARTNHAGRTASLVVTFHDAAGAQNAYSVTTTAVDISGTGWTRLTASGTVPAGSPRMYVRLYAVGGTVWAVNDYMDMTGVLVEHSLIPLDTYFDGDTPDVASSDLLTYTWAGTVNNSESIATGAHISSGSTPPFTYYASTAGMMGWKSGTETYRILAKQTHTTLFAFSSVGSVACGVGEYWGGRMQARVLSGTAVSILPRLGTYSSGGANLTTDQALANVQTLPADGSWVDLTFPSLNPTPAGAATIRFLLYASGTHLAGTTMEFRYATLENVGITGFLPTDYFDGSTLDTATADYSWVSTIDNSESIKKESYFAEATPPISWTFTGRTQKAYQVSVQKSDGGKTWLWTSGKITSAATTVTVPANTLKWNNILYYVQIRIWDTIDREATPGDAPYVESLQLVRYLYDATINPVTGLVGTKDTRYAGMVLTWSRATMPDNWNIYRDNKVIHTNTGVGLLVSGQNYTYTDWIPDPRKACTWQVVAVVNGKGSSNNPTVVDTVVPVTATLSAKDGSSPVLIWNYQHDMSLTEMSSVFQPAGYSPPIIITQSEHGYQGKLSGLLADNPIDTTLTPQQWRDRFNQLKKNNGVTLLLTLIDVAFECFIQNATIKPLIDGQGVKYYVEFEFFQTDWVEVS